MSKEELITVEDVPQAFEPGDKVLIPEWMRVRPQRVKGRNVYPDGSTRVAVVERVLFSPLNMGPTIILVKLYNGALVAFPVTDLERWRLHDDCATCTCKEPETTSETPKTFVQARALGHVIEDDEEEDDEEEED